MKYLDLVRQRASERREVSEVSDAEYDRLERIAIQTEHELTGEHLEKVLAHWARWLGHRAFLDGGEARDAGEG